MLQSNFQCQGILLTWIIIEEESTVLAVDAGWGYLDIFSLPCYIPFLLPGGGAARYRLKTVLKSC